jgi:hypothetical protein
MLERARHLRTREMRSCEISQMCRLLRRDNVDELLIHQDWRSVNRLDKTQREE